MIFWHFFYSANDQDTYSRQSAKFGDKMCKECKLALNDRFQGRLAVRESLFVSSLFERIEFLS